MYESIYNFELKKKLISLVKQNNMPDILKILYNELEHVKLSEKNTISFCSCGYPISFSDSEKSTSVILEDILNEETDYDDYTMTYYCPNCKKLLFENKY